MKILWVKPDFLHPTGGGGQIRTLETLKRLHRRHEIHFAALDLPQPGAGLHAARNIRRKRIRWRIQSREKADLVIGRACQGPLDQHACSHAALPFARLTAPDGVLTRLEKFDAIVCDFLASAANIPELETRCCFSTT